MARSAESGSGLGHDYWLTVVDPGESLPDAVVGGRRLALDRVGDERDVAIAENRIHPPAVPTAGRRRSINAKVCSCRCPIRHAGQVEIATIVRGAPRTRMAAPVVLQFGG